MYRGGLILNWRMFICRERESNICRLEGRMADDSGEPEDIGMEENVGVAWGGFDVSFKSHVLRLMQKGNLADVTLSNGTENFKCHRVILAACSPYFEKLFNDNASNTHMVVFLKGVESWEINAVVNFIYTGRAEVQKHLLSRLFDLAKGLQLRGFNTEKSMYRGQQLHPKQLLQQIEEEGKRKQSQRSGSKEEELSFEIAESSVSSDKNSVKRRKFTKPENANVTRIHSDSEPTFFSGGMLDSRLQSATSPIIFVIICIRLTYCFIVVLRKVNGLLRSDNSVA